MLNLFKMQDTTFKTAEELRDRLKTYGPILINGYYGRAFYKASAHRLTDPSGSYQFLGTRQLMGWKPSDVVEAKNIDRSIAHVINIIGIKYYSENPSCSRVLFLDPQDNSIPSE